MAQGSEAKVDLAPVCVMAASTTSLVTLGAMCVVVELKSGWKPCSPWTETRCQEPSRGTFLSPQWAPMLQGTPWQGKGLWSSPWFWPLFTGLLFDVFVSMELNVRIRKATLVALPWDVAWKAER